jgi:hypothetical protein
VCISVLVEKEETFEEAFWHSSQFGVWTERKQERYAQLWVKEKQTKEQKKVKLTRDGVNEFWKPIQSTYQTHT